MSVVESRHASDSGESSTEVQERRREAIGPRLSWASPRPFEPRSAVDAADVRGPSWREQEARYQKSTLVRDLLLCTSIPTLLLFALHGVSMTQFVWGVLMGLVFVALVAIERGYERVGVGDGPLEFQAILRGGVLTAAFLAMLGVGLNMHVPRTVVFGALPLMVCVLVLTRHLSRRRLDSRRGRGEAMKLTLVVGDVLSISRVVADLRAAPHHGYKIAGVCIPSFGVRSSVDTAPVLGTLADIPQVVADGGFDVVIVAGSELSGQAMRRLSWALERTQADLVVAPGLVEVFGPRVSLEPTAGLSLIHVRHADSWPARAAVKRAFDLSVSLTALLVALPLLIAIAVAIRLTSRGPVLFRQTRLGKGGEAFRMFKFRSMVVNAEAHLDGLLSQNEADGPLFKLENDPRVTRVGRYLRRHSLDELPQLLNVVRGEMALVGPRPPLAGEVAQYGEAMRRRLLVKPGATGLWQISGRADLPWDEAVKLDLRYVENWSIALDLMIMWKTVTVVLNGHGGR